MRKTVLKFGVISGVVLSLLLVATAPFADRIGFDKGEYLGYTIMVLSFLLVFFGIRSFRNDHGGQITFGKAFTVGMLITVITCVFYVVTWEVMYFFFLPGFMDKYAAYMAAKAQVSGATAAAIQAQLAAITFIEPFPVGLVIALVSAAVLRRKARTQAAGSAATASV